MAGVKTVTLSEVEEQVLAAMRARRPDLEDCVPDLLALHGLLVRCFDDDGTLYTCGNGGSNADAAHIAGELCKSFERRRPIPAELAEGLQGLPYAEELCSNLESGLRACTLGLNGALKTAVENDCALRDIAFAQELNALGRKGDVLLALSTSGNATNCLMALSVARAKGMATAALTGPFGGRMALHADAAIRAPGVSVKVIQEAHIVLYHTACALVEAHYFPEPR